MPSFNKVILAGNMTRDPELRYTPKGTAVCKVGLAINRQWKDEAGNQKEEVTFVDVDFFGRQAEAISQYKKKGHAILVEGRLKLDQWDDKQTGQKKSRLAVVGETCQFLDSGGGDHGGGDDRGGYGGGQSQGRYGGQRPAFRSNLRSGRTDDQPSGGGYQRPAQSSYQAPPPSDDMPPDAEDDVPF